MNYIVIMAGGSGTRLWPLSRQNKPKHLAKIIGEKTLLQRTYERVLKIVPKSQIYISTLADQAEEVLKQVPVSRERLFTEPALRNTAPAIGLAAFSLYKQDKDAVIATIASDHLIQEEEKFADIIKRGLRIIEKKPDYLLAIGIHPSRPETGFGYIKVGGRKAEKLKGKKAIEVLEAEKFVEKPDLKTAQKYLLSGRYLWNASYFIFKAETLRDWYRKFIPKTCGILKKIEEDNNIIGELYPQADSEPFDTAIAERVDKLLVIPAEIGWSDVGSWEVVHEILSNLTGKHLVAGGEHIDVGSEKILIHGQQKLVATVGLKDVIIIDTPDALLVLNRKKSQDVKKIVEKLKELKKEKYL